MPKYDNLQDLYLHYYHNTQMIRIDHATSYH